MICIAFQPPENDKLPRISILLHTHNNIVQGSFYLASLRRRKNYKSAFNVHLKGQTFHQFRKLHPKNKNIRIYSRISQPNPDFMFQYTYAARTRKGSATGKDGHVNQDTYVCSTKIDNQECIHLFAVCDGHGENGHLVSQFVKNKLPWVITTHKNLLKLNTPQALMIIFQTLSESLKATNIDSKLSGSTVVMIYIQNNKIYSANLGDSRAILLSRNGYWSAKQLSRDHKPNCQDEATRILTAGGRIEPIINSLGLEVGPLRIWANQTGPGLSMTRSIGDELAQTVGVIDKPEIQEFELTTADKVLILGSDGLFENLKDYQIIQSISPFYDQMNIGKACDQLMLTACNSWKQRNYIDDITFIILFLSY